mmetsp:Transcript_30633/g.98597  ORF Transcript_30633/g.98597 Transcript_30633/m.98597 type:complete len:218 (+) Transcript_30633:532-1185(+)
MKRAGGSAARNIAPAEARLSSMTMIGIDPRETRRRRRRSLTTRRRMTTTTGEKIRLPTSRREEVRSRSTSSRATPRLRISQLHPFPVQLSLIINQPSQEARLRPLSRTTGRTSAAIPSAVSPLQRLPAQSPSATLVTIPSVGLILSLLALLLPSTSLHKTSFPTFSLLLPLLLLPPWAMGRTQTSDSATSWDPTLQTLFSLLLPVNLQARRTPCRRL